MTWRLVLGAVMLQRRSLLPVILMAAAFRPRDGALEWIMGGAVMLMAGAAGMTTGSALQSRPMAVLPVSPREIARATWVLAVLLPIAILATGRILRASLSMVFADQWSWVFPAGSVRMFHEVLLFAVGGALAVLLPDRNAPDFREESSWFPIIAGFLCAMVAPFIVFAYLPATFAAITPTGWLLTAVSAVLASTPLFLKPKQYVRPSPPRAPIDAASTTPVRLGARAPERPARAKGLWAFAPSVMRPAGALAMVFVAFQLAVQWGKPAQTMLQPFDPAMSPARFVMTVCPILLMFIGMLPGLGQRVPMLRLLPVSPRESAASLTLAPLATPLTFWALLLCIHVAVSAAWPETIRIEYLIALCGLAALVDAIGIKSGSPMVKFAVGAPLVLTLTSVSDGDRELLSAYLRHWLVPMVGVVALVLAYLLNFHTVSRTERTSRAWRYGRSSSPQEVR